LQFPMKFLLFISSQNIEKTFLSLGFFTSVSSICVFIDAHPQ
jgi:hypothetical protein